MRIARSTLAIVLALGLAPTAAATGGGVCEIEGTEGRDVISGGRGNNVICGLGGRDTIFGNGGEDWLIGGQGADVIHGGREDDQLNGGPGRDRLYGDRGWDLLNGELDRDLLSGGPGGECLFSRDGLGGELILGGEGRDFAEADPGDRLSSAGEAARCIHPAP